LRRRVSHDPSSAALSPPPPPTGFHFLGPLSHQQTTLPSRFLPNTKFRRGTQELSLHETSYAARIQPWGSEGAGGTLVPWCPFGGKLVQLPEAGKWAMNRVNPQMGQIRPETSSSSSSSGSSPSLQPVYNNGTNLPYPVMGARLDLTDQGIRLASQSR